MIKADECTQYVVDIGVAINTFTQLIRNIRAVFECIRNAGIELTAKSCHFRVSEVEFLGPTAIHSGSQNQKFYRHKMFRETNKQVLRYIWVVTFYRN